MAAVIAGFDIGGTKTSLVVANSAGEQLHRSVEPTDLVSGSIDATSTQTTWHGLAEQLERMLCTALVELDHPQLKAVGIVSAGPIRSGGLWNPPNIVSKGIPESHFELTRHVPLVSPLREAFSCPVGLLNDCNGAVLGEVYYGLGKDEPSKSRLHLVYATISTGFGVGAWDGGHLVRGKDGNAGELGHIVARPDGLPCGCGNRGCVEAYASGSGIVRNAQSRLLSLDTAERSASSLFGALLESDDPPLAPATVVGMMDRLTPEAVFDAAERNEPLARAVIEDAIHAAGIALSAVANAYDPETISVGGGIALAHPELLQPIREEMLRHLNVIPPDVLLTPLGAEVTESGALAIARELVRESEGRTA